ncbi:MAG: phosphatase PAP2 family protein [Bdellovibrionales bacterium]|nr:phosphatase PAP2 family protein [Bdellovibrionales bacterium]
MLYRNGCAVTPSPCVIDSVNAFDRIAFRYGSITADFWSNVLQNTVGVILFLTPFLFAWRKKLQLIEAARDALYFAKITLWNGALIELVRTLVQRPRPLVFNNPMGDGANYHQYTSFYSGHTSFVALATLSLYFYFKRLEPRFARAAYGAFAGLTVLVAVLRVWGGRHYPTDVIGGAFAGYSIALFMQKHMTRTR